MLGRRVQNPPLARRNHTRGGFTPPGQRRAVPRPSATTRGADRAPSVQRATEHVLLLAGEGREDVALQVGGRCDLASRSSSTAISRVVSYRIASACAFTMVSRRAVSARPGTSWYGPRRAPRGIRLATSATAGASRARASPWRSTRRGSASSSRPRPPRPRSGPAPRGTAAAASRPPRRPGRAPDRDGGRLVIADVVDAGGASFAGGRRRHGHVVDVGERPHARARADQREASLADRLDVRPAFADRRPGPVEPAVRITRLGVSQPAAVKIADRLAADGLLERRRGPDRRTTALHLSPAGRQAAARLLAERAAELGELVSGLDPTERHVLERLLERLVPGLADDRTAALRTCRLCDRAACYGSGPDCPLEHATQ